MRPKGTINLLNKEPFRLEHRLKSFERTDIKKNPDSLRTSCFEDGHKYQCFWKYLLLCIFVFLYFITREKNNKLSLWKKIFALYKPSQPSVVITHSSLVKELDFFC